MKPLLAPVVSGFAVAGILYGLLCAAERRLPEPEDPWLDAFLAEGMKADFRSLSSEPQNQALPSDLRSAFAGPSFAGTQLRNYQVQNTSVQVVRLPAPGLLPEVPEGRKTEVRYKPQSNPIHVCRSGRTILFVAAFGKWIPIVGQMKTPKKDVDLMFDAFEEAARRIP